MTFLFKLSSAMNELPYSTAVLPLFIRLPVCSRLTPMDSWRSTSPPRRVTIWGQCPPISGWSPPCWETWTTAMAGGRSTSEKTAARPCCGEQGSTSGGHFLQTWRRSLWAPSWSPGRRWPPQGVLDEETRWTARWGSHFGFLNRTRLQSREQLWSLANC